jgi:hypothetical protein
MVPPGLAKVCWLGAASTADAAYGAPHMRNLGHTRPRRTRSRRHHRTHHNQRCDTSTRRSHAGQCEVPQLTHPLHE